jgi:glycosyltransferase involved in cell wall biosynthesis
MTSAIQKVSEVWFSPAAGATCGEWLNVVAHLDPRYGGLSAGVPALSSSISATGEASVSVGAFCRSGEEFRPAVAPDIKVHYFPVERLSWFRDSAARRRFDELVARSAGLHVHGLWEISTNAAVRSARAHRKPYLLSAHGMLERWALSNKWLRKQIYAALFERANLRGAACLHALTHAEAQNYRDFGLRNPIAVIPNGVEIPASLSAGMFRAHFPELRDKKVVLFLGRIHYKKGLDILTQAWSQLASQWRDAQLVLAGPDFEDTEAEIRKMLRHLGVESRVTFTGMLTKELKWSALAAAHCFVLPSYSEGLSLSVLEAMGAGVPVIVTEQCNLPEVSIYSCGWVIHPRTGELTVALDEVLRASHSKLSEMGANGRRVVADHYTWRVVGKQMSSLYHWLQGGRKSVHLEVLEAA